MTVRVQYQDVPSIYLTEHSFLSSLVAKATNQSVSIVESQPDIIFHSVHRPFAQRGLTAARDIGLSLGGRLTRDLRRRRSVTQRENSLASKSIWFTGENIRPPIGEWAATFSFDTDDLGGRNVYLPLWWENLGLVGQPSTTFTSASVRKILDLVPQPTDIVDRAGFVCAFIGNPTRMRMHAIEALSAIAPVEVFGRWAGRPVKDQHSIARNFRYMLCFENDLYPGYVTEKAADAWANGCIPLWWGLDPERYINPAAVINAGEIGIGGMTTIVRRLELDSSLLTFTAQQPLLTRIPDLEACLAAIRRALGPDGI